MKIKLLIIYLKLTHNLNKLYLICHKGASKQKFDLLKNLFEGIGFDGSAFMKLKDQKDRLV